MSLSLVNIDFSHQLSLVYFSINGLSNISFMYVLKITCRLT